MSDDARKQIPGCGLAAFAFVLLGIFLVGITGVTLSTLSVFSSGLSLSPKKLSYGGVVDARMLEPMRAAGLIGPNEVPDAFHAEDTDGTRACAISTDRVVRVSPEQNAALPLADIREVTGTEYEVVIHGEPTIVCHFGEGEGGDRFLRMLEQR